MVVLLLFGTVVSLKDTLVYAQIHPKSIDMTAMGGYDHGVIARNCGDRITATIMRLFGYSM